MYKMKPKKMAAGGKSSNELLGRVSSPTSRPVVMPSGGPNRRRSKPTRPAGRPAGRPMRGRMRRAEGGMAGAMQTAKPC